MIHRDSEAYKAAGKYVHPEHTELYLLQNRATHLPEFIEHYWTDDYLIIVTKAHGIRKSKLNLLGDTYHEVKWIYYFNQVV